jgi:glycosyltransferase involved in cell wall biosynthesis
MVHALLARITGLNGFFSFFSTQRLIKYIDKFNPDIIHIHELHAYFVNINALIKHIKKKNIPVVWTFHCEYMYTGKCGHAYDCLNFTEECGNCPAVKDYPKSIIFDFTKKMLQIKKNLLVDWDFRIITPSMWLLRRVKMSFLKEKPIKVIHNGIDTNVFHPVESSDLKKQLNIPADYKVVLALAPNIMSDSKGGHWVLSLAEQMKNEKVFFVLVGDA